MPNPLSRRGFLGGTAATAALTVAAGRASAGAADVQPLRAAVLEYADPFTKATGAARLLTAAGVSTVALDTTKAADAQGVDLIVFGGFTNNGTAYPAYLNAQTTSLRRFVQAGGVVLDLAQSDQFGATVTYLPPPMTATRADPDHDTVFLTDRDHPLFAGLPVAADGTVLAERSTAMRTSYETLVSWNEMRVLAAVTVAGQPPCLLEGQLGKGRFLVTSLTLDKCYDAAGASVQPAAALRDSQTFFTALATYVRSVKDGTAAAVVPTPVPTEPAAGPMVGHVTDRTARIWVRPGANHRSVKAWRVIVRGDEGRQRIAEATMSDDNDYTVLFDVTGLRAHVRYTYEITPATATAGFVPLTGSFTTSPTTDTPTVVTMGMGSCAPSGPDPVWDRVVAEGCDSFVLLGDTPYIDSTDLRVARQKQREFLMQPQVARMISTMPTWGTWDDHDFGGNDVDGTLGGKRNNRMAFVDYRANASFGQTIDGKVEKTRDADSEGVYTSFRRGPIEMFLLDPRWFSQTGKSFADRTKPSCLGDAQWAWLRRSLRASTATFKVIASGMIWDDKENSEKDDWATYVYEREAIYNFVAAEKIKGVVLVSGDIHVSRALNYGPRVGYDLWQFIVSPLHDRTIPSLNVPNPALVHSAVEPNVFLKMVADTTVKPARLTSTWINRDGKRIFEVDLTADQLGYRRNAPKPTA